MTPTPSSPHTYLMVHLRRVVALSVSRRRIVGFAGMATGILALALSVSMAGAEHRERGADDIGASAPESLRAVGQEIDGTVLDAAWTAAASSRTVAVPPHATSDDEPQYRPRLDVVADGDIAWGRAASDDAEPSVSAPTLRRRTTPDDDAPGRWPAAPAQPAADRPADARSSVMVPPVRTATSVATISRITSDDAPSAPETPIASTYLNPRELGLLEAMNNARRAAALPSLRLDTTLTVAARQRSQDMSVSGYFAHVSPEGETWLTLVRAAGIELTAGGENLARVSGDVERSVEVAVDKLLRSPTHRANILNHRYERVGVGATVSPDGVTIFTSIFTD